jgi:DNA-binding FadR family transcriptional regulator
MQGFLNAMNRPLHTKQSYAEPDLHFHQEALMASGNPFMQSFSTVVEAAILCSFEISAPVDGQERLDRSILRHQTVLDAITAADPGSLSARSGAWCASGGALHIGDFSRQHGGGLRAGLG